MYNYINRQNVGWKLYCNICIDKISTNPITCRICENYFHYNCIFEKCEVSDDNVVVYCLNKITQTELKSQTQNLNEEFGVPGSSNLKMDIASEEESTKLVQFNHNQDTPNQSSIKSDLTK